MVSIVSLTFVGLVGLTRTGDRGGRSVKFSQGRSFFTVSTGRSSSMSKRPRKPEDLGLRESDFSDFSGDDESNRPDTVGNETNRSDINGDDGNDEASSDSELEILEVNPVVPDKRRRSSPAGPPKRRAVGTVSERDCLKSGILTSSDQINQHRRAV